MNIQRWIALLGLLLFNSLAIDLQNSQLFVYNETDYTLDQNTIQQAAQPLIDEGARVAVYLVAENGSADDFLQRLQRDRLGNGSNASDDVIAVYVSLSPRYAEIRWGENYDARLRNRADAIREGNLNPSLRERQFTNGFVQTLEGIHSAITTRVSPEEALNNLVTGIPGVAWLIIAFASAVFGIPMVQSWFTGNSYWHHLGKVLSSGSSSSDSSDWGSSSGGGSSGSGGSSSGGGSSGGSW